MDTTRFIISRKLAFVGALFPCRIYINGAYVGKLRNGRTLIADVPWANAYYLEDGTFSRCNAVVKDNGKKQYCLSINSVGGRHTDSYNTFSVEDGPVWTVDLGGLTESIFAHRTGELPQADRTLALCLEFDFGIRDDLSEIFLSEDLFPMLDALQEVGAVRYVEWLRHLMDVDFAGVRFPMSEEETERMREKIEAAEKIIWKDKCASEELYRATVRFLLENLDRLTIEALDPPK